MTDTPFTPALDHETWQPGIECEHGYDACPICDGERSMTELTKEERAELRKLAESYPRHDYGSDVAAQIAGLIDALDTAEQRIADLEEELSDRLEDVCKLEAIIEETEREEARDNGQFGVGA